MLNRVNCEKDQNPMRHVFKSFCLAMLLLHANTGLAQETTDQTPATTDDGLALGEPVGPAIGEPYISAEYGDWSLRCIKAAPGDVDQCNLYQLLISDEGASVAEFNIFQLPAGGQAAAGATLVVPLETLLTQQITIAIDGQNARRYPFNFCNRAGCVARIGFTQAEVDEFKRGNQATVRIVPAAAPTQEVVLAVSLTGFTAGYDSVAAAE
jgi:invasion protein IalB